MVLSELRTEGCCCPKLLNTNGSFLLGGSDDYCDVIINTPGVLDHVKEGYVMEVLVLDWYGQIGGPLEFSLSDSFYNSSLS